MVAGGAVACSGDAEDAGADDTTAETDDALTANDAAARANLAAARLVSRFWDRERDTMRATFPGDGHDAGYWIYAQAFDAVLDAAKRPDGKRFEPEVARFYDAQARRGFRRDFFDDETWMALALVRAHDLTGERRYLAEAKSLVDDVMAHGWVRGDGVWWDRKHTQHATASNFGPVIAGVRLAARTHDARYLDFAERVYAHWYAHAVDAGSHEVADHVDRDGRVVWWRFTYDQGLAIGAALALHNATGEARYLRDAHGYAAFLVEHETTATRFGPVLFDGDACSGDCDAFKGIAFRYLRALYEADKSHTEYARVLDASASAIWELARTPRSTTFSTSWNAPGRRATTLAADASATMALVLAVDP